MKQHFLFLFFVVVAQCVKLRIQKNSELYIELTNYYVSIGIGSQYSHGLNAIIQSKIHDRPIKIEKFRV